MTTSNARATKSSPTTGASLLGRVRAAVQTLRDSAAATLATDEDRAREDPQNRQTSARRMDKPTDSADARLYFVASTPQHDDGETTNPIAQAAARTPDRGGEVRVEQTLAGRTRLKASPTAWLQGESVEAER